MRSSRPSLTRWTRFPAAEIKRPSTNRFSSWACRVPARPWWSRSSPGTQRSFAGGEHAHMGRTAPPASQTGPILSRRAGGFDARTIRGHARAIFCRSARGSGDGIACDRQDARQHLEPAAHTRALSGGAHSHLQASSAGYLLVDLPNRVSARRSPMPPTSTTSPITLAAQDRIIRKWLVDDDGLTREVLYEELVQRFPEVGARTRRFCWARLGRRVPLLHENDRAVRTASATQVRRGSTRPRSVAGATSRSNWRPQAAASRRQIAAHERKLKATRDRLGLTGISHDDRDA